MKMFSGNFLIDERMSRNKRDGETKGKAFGEFPFQS